MNDRAERLPADVASCHALINQLSLELEETRRKLAVHEENQRQQMEHLYGRGVTAEKLLAFGKRMNRPISEQERREMEQELAAEDAMRRRRKK